MQLFVITAHCTSRLHCRVCRNKEGGRIWRQSLAKNFTLPDNNIDFECPYGLQWNAQPPKPEKPPEDCPDCRRNAEKPKVAQAPEPLPITTPAQVEKVRSGTRNRGGCGCGRG
jgi:hypothetical protein